MNYEGVLRFGFDWLKTRDSIKILLPYSIFALFVALFQYWQESLPDFDSFDTSVLSVIASIAVLWIVLVLVSVYFSGMAIVFALKRTNRSPQEFNISGFVGIILVGIFVFLRSFFWAHGRTARLIQWACLGLVVLFGLGAIIAFVASDRLFALVFLAFGVLALMPYSLIIIYTTVRYSMSEIIYLDKRIGQDASVRESWEITSGRFWEILVASVVASFLTGLAVLIVSAVFAGTIFLPFFLARGFSSSFFVFSVAFNFLVELLIFFPRVFISVGIYDQLSLRAQPRQEI